MPDRAAKYESTSLNGSLTAKKTTQPGERRLTEGSSGPEQGQGLKNCPLCHIIARFGDGRLSLSDQL